MTKPTVLIIEDETALLYALNAELSTAGFNVLTSADGKEGLEQIESQKPNFVILDIWLPSMTGIEILEKVSESEKLKKTPILVVSNSASDETIAKAKKLGAVDYLVKTDHSLDEIARKIKDYLASHGR